MPIAKKVTVAGVVVLASLLAFLVFQAVAADDRAGVGEGVLQISGRDATNAALREGRILHFKIDTYTRNRQNVHADSGEVLDHPDHTKVEHWIAIGPDELPIVHDVLGTSTEGELLTYSRLDQGFQTFVDIAAELEERYPAGAEISLIAWVDSKWDGASSLAAKDDWTETNQGRVLSEPSRKFEREAAGPDGVLGKSTLEIGSNNPLLVSTTTQKYEAGQWVIVESSTITHMNLLPAGSQTLPTSILAQ